MKHMVPVPLALRHLIESNNQLLKTYQEQLLNKVMTANEEMMRMLNLNPEDGWRLDLDNYTYVKTEQSNDTSVS
jgi:hypothetical protein